MTQQTAAPSQAGAQLGSRAKKSLGPCPRHRTTSRERELNQGHGPLLGPLPGPLGNKGHLDAEGTLLFSSSAQEEAQRPRGHSHLSGGLSSCGGTSSSVSQRLWGVRTGAPECQGAPFSTLISSLCCPLETTGAQRPR